MMRLWILAAGAAEWVAGLALAGVLGAYAAIIAVYQRLSTHAENSTRHPNGDQLVYDDVCTERVKRIEASIQATGEKIDALAAANARQFAELKRLICNGQSRQD